MKWMEDPLGKCFLEGTFETPRKAVGSIHSTLAHGVHRIGDHALAAIHLDPFNRKKEYESKQCKEKEKQRDFHRNQLYLVSCKATDGYFFTEFLNCRIKKAANGHLRIFDK